MAIFRAPMRSRIREVPAGAGAEFGIAYGIVGGQAPPEDVSAVRSFSLRNY